MTLRDWQKGRMGVVALAALVLAAACNKSKAEQQAMGPEIAAVEQRDLNVSAEASGLVEPIQTVEIKSKASGEVLAVHVETGQEAARGALLVEVEPRDVRNALAAAEADLEVAQARALTSGANLKRVQELRQTNVATEQETETAMLENANARAQLVKARTNLELAQERMKDVTIRAPMSGTVIEKTIEPGSIIASASGTFGGGTTLLKMADLSTVQVRALVDQTDIGKVEAGQSARVTVEAYPGRPFTGEVVKVEPQAVVEQNVTMFPVLIHLRNDDRLLKPGMNTEVEIEIAQKQNAIVIPNDAVVALRDANTAGAALGLSEGEMKSAMERLRENMRAQFAGAGAGPGAGAAAGEGERERGREGASAAQVSAECDSLRAKVRAAGGPDALNEAERAKLRECFAGVRRQGEGAAASTAARQTAQGSARGTFGGASARRASTTTRRGIVFVPGQDGPEPRMVTLGVNDWDYTEVISGLQPGENVFLMTAARLQQQQKELADRVRQRSNQMGGMRQSTTSSQSGQGGQGGPGGR